MCYVKPGPRCSGHAFKNLEDAKASGDAEKIRKAQREYALTPAGIKELEEVNPAAAEILEENRQRMIAAVKAQKIKHEEEKPKPAETDASSVFSPDFDMDKADPTDFDSEQSRIDGELQSKYSNFDRFYKANIRSKYDSRIRQNGEYQWQKTDAEVMEELKKDTSPEATALKKEYSEHAKGIKEHKKAMSELNSKFLERGGWNRAFLATSGGDGHVHKSTSCSTCNKGKDPTRFQWMTNYSGKDEGSIVSDAGYRACTVCYPSAPVGNERSLPTKMFSDEEKEKQKARTEREEKAATKAAQAISKAPTASGKPLNIDGRIFKTETTAISAYTEGSLDYYMDRAETDPEYKSNPEFMKQRREHSYMILKSLAEKRDVSIREVQEELKPKLMTKIRKHNRDRLKPSHISIINNLPHRDGPEVEYFADDFGLSEEKYNTSPNSW